MTFFDLELHVKQQAKWLKKTNYKMNSEKSKFLFYEIVLK